MKEYIFVWIMEISILIMSAAIGAMIIKKPVLNGIFSNRFKDNFSTLLIVLMPGFISLPLAKYFITSFLWQNISMLIIATVWAIWGTLYLYKNFKLSLRGRENDKSNN